MINNRSAIIIFTLECFLLIYNSKNKRKIIVVKQIINKASSTKAGMFLTNVVCCLPAERKIMHNYIKHQSAVHAIIILTVFHRWFEGMKNTDER